jgi:two-component system NarL family sensor kinase
VALLPVFFLLPISVAFQDRPGLTAIVGICTAVGYLGVWIVCSKRDDAVELPSVVYTHFGLLLWLAAAMTALCYFLTRAAARVAALLDMRRTLVSESMRADERHSRALAEQLHDGPLQDLLAARLNLTKSANGIPIRGWTPPTRQYRTRQPGCAAPSPHFIPRCSPKWVSPPRCVS